MIWCIIIIITLETHTEWSHIILRTLLCNKRFRSTRKRYLVGTQERDEFFAFLNNARATTGEIVVATAAHVYHKCQREGYTDLFFSFLSFIVMAFFQTINRHYSYAHRESTRFSDVLSLCYYCMCIFIMIFLSIFVS